MGAMRAILPVNEKELVMKIGALLFGIGTAFVIALAGKPAAAKCVLQREVVFLHDKYEVCRQPHLQQYYSQGANGQMDLRRCGAAGFSNTIVMQTCPNGEDGQPQIELRPLCVGKGPHPQPIVLDAGRQLLCWTINPPGAVFEPNALVVRSVKK